MIEVNSVEAVPGFGLLLTFNSGEQRRFDMCPYLHYPVFRRLENHLVWWEFIQHPEDKTGSLRLSKEKQHLDQLHNILNRHHLSL